ncbi:hypothetical protein B0I35DRAFT_481801 [Stachybotrys elegans]|uniref:Uncharacterized protein n=1 Tax=Stachybotrys elegans TaxID=80388 RepID=A0A8K0WM69_9HYPO|nr:hypothetical protein B0I35DRAFT_481801 [Stachybotrys elegans]
MTSVPNTPEPPASQQHSRPPRSWLSPYTLALHSETENDDVEVAGIRSISQSLQLPRPTFDHLLSQVTTQHDYGDPLDGYSEDSVSLDNEEDVDWDIIRDGDSEHGIDSARAARPNVEPINRDLSFDWGTAMVSDGTESSVSEESVHLWEWEIPFGALRQEQYDFEDTDHAAVRAVYRLLVTYQALGALGLLQGQAHSAMGAIQGHAHQVLGRIHEGAQETLGRIQGQAHGALERLQGQDHTAGNQLFETLVPQIQECLRSGGQISQFIRNHWNDIRAINESAWITTVRSVISESMPRLISSRQGSEQSNTE